MLLDMSTVGRFFSIKVKEFHHKCQPGVSRWSIMDKIGSTQFANDPSACQGDGGYKRLQQYTEFLHSPVDMIILSL